MSAENLKDLMGDTMEKIRQMVDTDTIIGKAITVDGTTIIPVSKVTYGFGSGGGDIANKNQCQKDLFGGAGAAGISVIPIAFLHIKNGNLKVTQVEPYFSSVDRMLELAPEIIERIKNLFKKEESNTKDIDDITKNSDK